MATTDIKILEARLLTRDSAVTGSTVTKCALRLQQLMAAIQNPESKRDESDEALEAFCRDLLLYKVEMGKFDQAFNMLDNEALEYSGLEANIEAKIEETTQSINTLTQDLIQQKKLKQHREECEALSRIVNLVPSTRKILASTDVVHEEIDRLEEQLASTESVEKLRSRQVNLLLQSIADITQSLDEENDMQKQLLKLQQSVHNQTQDDDEVNEDVDRDDDDGEEESRHERGERGQAKRKKPSGESEDDALEAEKEEGEAEEEEEEDAQKKKVLKTSIELVEEGGEPTERINSPVAMTVKEKLLQQQEKRAQKKREKEMREKEQQGGVDATGTAAETEEGEEEEEEGAMDTTA